MAEASILGGSGKLTLDDDVFGAPFNGPLVHECVVAELAAKRRGTHATKTRGMVRGGGAKPWRQKGTGRARAGSSRSPVWTGGGTVFGPSPRHYTVKVNRKARRAALRSALSLHAGRGSLFGVDAGGFDAPSTKQAAGLLEDTRGGATLDRAQRGGGARRQVVPQPRPRHRARRRERGRGRHRPARHAHRLPGGDRRADRPRDEGPQGGDRLMDPSQVIIRPVVSEKSYVLATADKYTFRVHKDAHKTQIKQAIEQLFDVTVLEVRTSAVPSKPKRRGYTSGRTREWKKAVVQVREGDSIPIFQGLEADL